MRLKCKEMHFHLLLIKGEGAVVQEAAIILTEQYGKRQKTEGTVVRIVRWLL